MSTVMTVVAVVLALAGGIALYAREEIADSHAFSVHAQTALEKDAVRRVVAREIVVQLIERGSARLITARPALEAVVDVIIKTPPFLKLFRAGAEQAHKLLFVRDGGNAAFDVADVGTVVGNALQGVLPATSRGVPRDVQATLITLRKRSFATQTLRISDKVRVFGLILPIVAVLLLVGAVAIAPDRRRALTRAGVGIGVAAGLLAVVMLAGRAYVTSHVYGSDELTDAEVRGAIGGLWDAFLGPLLIWALVIGGVALVVAAASASILRPYAAGEELARLRARLRPPEAPLWRAAHGVVVMAVGLFIVLQPTLAVRVGAVVAGAFTLYYGAGEILSATYSPAERRETEAATRAGRRRRRTGLAAAGALVAAGAIAVIILASSGGTPSVAQANVKVCNGYEQLCRRRLDQVVFAGTHNSMSAADVPGWALVNQRRDIERQLKDGIRLFLLDPHYGIKQPNGRVTTDFDAEKRAPNKVSEALSPAAVDALENVGARLGGASGAGGSPDVWLCHTVCELGATKMVDELTTIRKFLQRNPGEVVIIFDEDYVSEKDLDKTYRAAGLGPYLATLDRLKPLPTLGQLVRSDKRLIVLSERRPSGRYPWDGDGFAWVQDTPFDIKTPDGLRRCQRGRGTPNSPLLMLNQFIEKFPPSPDTAKKVGSAKVIVARAKACRRERGMGPNLIATDFYDDGQVVQAARALNGVGDVKPAPIR